MSTILRIQKKYIAERKESRKAKDIKAARYLENLEKERTKDWEKKRFSLTFLAKCVIL